MRACSLPLVNRNRQEGLLSSSNASTSSGSAWVKKLQPGRTGYFPNDNSVDERESQEKKRSINELAEFAQTAPPGHAVPQQHLIVDSASTTRHVHNDPERRRRLLEPVQIKRLFRVHRSLTTSDLNIVGLPRASIEVALKKSSSGRKYKKITGDPNLYGNESPSIYQINLEMSKRKGQPQWWLNHKSQRRSDSASNASEVSGQTSYLLNDSDDHWKKVMDEYPHVILESEIREPTKAVTNQYSPSKGLPKPEPANLQEFAATTTRAIAQAHAYAQAHAKSPERLAAQSRERASPTRKRGKHAGHRKILPKGPHSVPIKFQMRPGRNSLPRTPRTSFDQSVPVGTAPPSHNQSVEPSPTKSKSGSVGDDGQSDAESGVIMNAQSAEFIQGQGVVGFHARSLRKPPKPGPAPTRALPSLPEGRDNGTPISGQVVTEALLPPALPAGGGSPILQKSPKSPHKGHRYRLSPVKNNVPNGLSTQSELRPSPILAEGFPRPPCSSKPDICSQVMPYHQNHELDISDAVAPGDVENADFEDAATLATNTLDRPTTLGNSPSPKSSSDPISKPVFTAVQHSKDADKDNLYMPWQQSRVGRVKQLRARDVERQRSRLQNVKNSDVAGQEAPRSDEARDQEDPATPLKQRQNSVQRSDSALGPQDSRLSSLERPADEKGKCCSRRHHEISPVNLVAEQLPSTADHDPSTHPKFNFYPIANGEMPAPTAQSLPCTTDELSHSMPCHPLRASSPHVRAVSRQPSHESTTAGCPDPLCHNTFSSSTTAHTLSDVELRLEARIAAVEKKNMLLERAFLAVIDASSGYRSTIEGGENGRSRRESERLSAASEVLAPLTGRVDAMLMAMQGKGGGVG
ncbi:MAG: hypothetical protein Q9222_003205 [Ikaeria aurantiellina]